MGTFVLGVTFTERSRTNEVGASVYHKLTKEPVWKKKSEEDRNDIPEDENVSKRYRFNIISLESQIGQGLGDGTRFDNWWSLLSSKMAAVVL